MDSGEGQVARTFARYVCSSFLRTNSAFLLLVTYVSMVTGFYLHL